MDFSVSFCAMGRADSSLAFIFNVRHILLPLLMVRNNSL